MPYNVIRRKCSAERDFYKSINYIELYWIFLLANICVIQHIKKNGISTHSCQGPWTIYISRIIIVYSTFSPVLGAGLMHHTKPFKVCPIHKNPGFRYQRYTWRLITIIKSVSPANAKCCHNFPKVVRKTLSWCKSVNAHIF